MFKNILSRFAHPSLRLLVAVVLLTALAAIIPVAALHEGGKIPLAKEVKGGRTYNIYTVDLVGTNNEFDLTNCRAGTTGTEPQLNGKYNVQVTNDSGGAQLFNGDVEFTGGDAELSISAKLGSPGKVSICLPKKAAGDSDKTTP